MKVFIIHRWDGKPNSDWYPWLKKELENKGDKVTVPKMPNTSEPEINYWVEHLSKLIGIPDKDTCLIGHSMGCQAIMRYLETLPKNTILGKLIFVAGWFKLANLEDPDVEEIAKPWLTTPIDFSKVKEKTNKITVILSENDPYNEIEHNREMFKTKLNAKIITLKKGHFTSEDGVTKLPEILKLLP